ncbi:MAG: hypothetical protein Q8916_07120 [Bacteroidota bacterium]|nr:hypothetical protein [Bacteroidota bacterium]MDP4230162.1 hypothetical protein [Bacteroidota bacterium]MDP4236274.1 hypothetical protein [Bacteroidota bacterium]
MKLTGLLFLLFGLIALGLGIAMVADKTLLNQFDSTLRTVFIVLLFVYGAYRLWTAIGTMRNSSKTQSPAK